MDKLKKMVEKSPDLKSDRSEYLKLAVKEGKVVRGTGPHQVVLIGCENAVNRDYQTQKEVKGINLLFEEKGEKKKYFVPTLGDDSKFHYLIERFAEIEEGTELVLEYKRKEGSVRGFIEVREAQEIIKGQEVGQVEDEEIPIVEDEITSENLGTGHAPKMED